MKKDHLAESTIKVTDRGLRLIAKTVNLNEPRKINDYEKANNICQKKKRVKKDLKKLLQYISVVM